MSLFNGAAGLKPHEVKVTTRTRKTERAVNTWSADTWFENEEGFADNGSCLRALVIRHKSGRHWILTAPQLRRLRRVISLQQLPSSLAERAGRWPPGSTK